MLRSTRKKGAIPARRNRDNPMTSSHHPDANQNPPPSFDTTKAWGQQCSPNCGCVVRFETDFDRSTQTFTSATFHAKTVVLTRHPHKPSEWIPLRTQRTNRPQFQACKCTTLHQLASQVTEYLPGKTLSAVQNATEFHSVRSSRAFRHTILVEQQLPRSDTHCFDLVEEAFSGMVHGHIPRPRRKSIVRQNSQYGMDRDPFNVGLPQPVSALHMFDLHNQAVSSTDILEPLEEMEENEEQPVDRTAPSHYDWLKWVDEMYQKEDETKTA